MSVLVQPTQRNSQVWLLLPLIVLNRVIQRNRNVTSWQKQKLSTKCLQSIYKSECELYREISNHHSSSCSSHVTLCLFPSALSSQTCNCIACRNLMCYYKQISPWRNMIRKWQRLSGENDTSYNCFSCLGVSGWIHLTALLTFCFSRRCDMQIGFNPLQTEKWSANTEISGKGRLCW